MTVRVAAVAVFLVALATASGSDGGFLRRDHRHGLRARTQTSGGVGKELEVVTSAVDRAQRSTAMYPSMMAGKNAVQMKRMTPFAQTVRAVFPSATCVERSDLMAAIPSYMVGNATLYEPEVIDASGNCQYGLASELADPGPIPALCALDHGFANAHGQVCSGDACLLSKAFSRTKEFVSKPFYNCDPTGCSLSLGRTKHAAEHDIVYVMSQHNNAFYGHFMTESFLRLSVGLDYLLGTGARAKVHVRDRTGPYAGIMEAMGVTADRIVVGDVRARAILLPEPVYTARAPKQLFQLARWTVRNTIPMDFAPESRGRLPTITVIHRSQKRERRVTNNDALVAQLRAEFPGHQVKIFDDGAMPSWKETMRLLAGSAVIVAPHGAGLGNILAANAGGAVVELYPSMQGDKHSCGSYVFLQESAHLGLHHHLLYVKGAAFDDPMVVDVPEVVSAVRSALEKQKVELA